MGTIVAGCDDRVSAGQHCDESHRLHEGRKGELSGALRGGGGGGIGVVGVQGLILAYSDDRDYSVVALRAGE